MVEISVVMAVYNVGNENTVRLAVESVLNQTFRNFELIICDDCSTDNTFNVLQELSRKDSRVILLRNEANIKSGGTRNRCIEIARGRYIAVMDSDDYSSPDRLEKEYAFLQENDRYAFVGSKGQYFELYPGDLSKFYWYCARPQKQDFLMTLPFVHASLMFRREALQEVNGYSTKREVTRSEDYDILMRLYAKGYIGANMDEVLYHIRCDNNTYKRRKYRYRFCEFFVKREGFDMMGLMPKGILYAIKPLVVGLIPIGPLNWLREGYYK